jgi:formate hydrogenlyase subunit 3/multisubunit Na+/H+ antiporter MnhD subunit
MNMAGGALGLMAGGYAAGACLPALMPSHRAARVVTALGAVTGCVGGLTAAATVIATGQSVEASFPSLVGVAGGIVIGLDRLGALFLTLVAAVSFLAAVYGVSYTAEYDGRRSLRVFGLMFNGFLLGMSLVTRRYRMTPATAVPTTSIKSCSRSGRTSSSTGGLEEFYRVPRRVV